MNSRWIGAIIFSVAGIIIAITCPIASLTPLGHKVLMALMVGVGLWVFQPARLPFSVSGCLVLTILLIIGVDKKLVFAGFISSTVWVLIPATAFGYVLTKTGLGKRIALLVIKTFKPTYLNMTFAWLIIGLILSAFTPSIVIRIVIVMPIAASCANILRLEKKSDGNAFILLIAWAMAIIPGSGWLTGSLWGPITMGMYEKVTGLAGFLTSGSWMTVMMVPMFILTALVIFGLYIILSPGSLPELSKDIFVKAYDELGEWDTKEISSTIVLVITFFLFLSEPFHGVGVVPICLGSFFTLFAMGVLEPNDVATGIAWNLVIFIGVVLSFTGIFAATGISAWIKEILFPFISTFGKNPWMFVMVVPLFMFAWRFLDIAWMIPTTALLIAILPTIYKQFGIHPLVSSCLMIMAGNFAFLSYMQPFALIGSTLSEDRSWTPRQLMKYGTVYIFSCIITLAISIVYWKIIGFIE